MPQMEPSVTGDAEMDAARPPDHFVEQLRDALHHLYDLAYLQTHPLLGLAGAAPKPAQIDAKYLRRALLDAIEAFHPEPGVAATSRAWRAYRILELRYIEGSDAATATEKMGLSKAQYYREHDRALHAVASVLWRQWRLAAAGPVAPGAALRSMSAVRADARQVEASHLFSDGAGSYIDVAEVLAGVADLVRPLSEQRGIVIGVTLLSDPPAIRGDRTALRHALLSVLVPLLKAASPGRLAVTVNAASGAAVEIVVDSPPLALEPSAEPNLEVARPFVEALKGWVHCSRHPAAPHGWMVRLTFPIDRLASLLVVDNNADFVRLVQRYLDRRGWNVIGVPDIDQAHARIQQQRFHAILLDAVLPLRDGWELLVSLKATPATRAIPVIICSVLNEPEVALSQGAAAYLQKPIGQWQLIDTLGPYC